MRKLFLDCGAWRGSSVDRFRADVPDAPEFEIHCFEPNPDFWDDISQKDVHLHKFAVGSNNRTEKFSVNAGSAKGGSFNAEKSSVMDGYVNKTLDVDVKNISEWIESNVNDSDYCILKLNVEGAEYEIIDSLDTGMSSLVDEVWIDWHWDKVGMHWTKQQEYENKLRSIVKVVREWNARDGENRENGFTHTDHGYHLPVIFFKGDVNWKKDEYGSFESGSIRGMPENQHDRLKVMAAKWRSYFSMSIEEYRNELQIMSLESVRRTGLPTTSDLNIAKRHRSMVPIDDDDWIFPDIATIIENEWGCKNKSLAWRNWVISNVIPDYMFKKNNLRKPFLYAIQSKFYGKCGDASAYCNIHFRESIPFTCHLARPICHVNTIASVSWLLKNKQANPFRSFCEKVESGITRNKTHKWFGRYTKRLWNLDKRLVESRVR